MKIIKRLSLMSTINLRTTAPKPHNSWLSRWLNRRYEQHTMSVEQQLIKNGYTSKPAYNSIRLIIGAVGIFVGFFVHLYIINIYKVIQNCLQNEIKARNKYRIEQNEHSSLQIRGRRALFKLSEFIESRLFMLELFFQNCTLAFIQSPKRLRLTVKLC